MLRVLAMVVAALVLTACGADSGSDSGSEKKSGSASETKAPEASYFEAADTSAINGPAAAIQAAGTKALDRPSIDACNTIDAYPAWRKCWHGLLDPLSSSLTALAGVWTSFEKRDLPDDCLAATTTAAQTFSGFAGKVDAVLKGIDSDKRKEQVKAGASYYDSVNTVAQGYTKPFQEVTRACYSPEDLASINASPSPSP